MSRDLVTVEMDDRLAEIRDIFDNVRFHHLLVVDERRLAGVISDRDLTRELSPWLGTPGETPRDVATLNRRAHQIMSRRLVTASPGESVSSACEKFLTERVSCLPVVDDAGEPLGIVTWRDMLEVLALVARSGRAR